MLSYQCVSGYNTCKLINKAYILVGNLRGINVCITFYRRGWAPAITQNCNQAIGYNHHLKYTPSSYYSFVNAIDTIKLYTYSKLLQVIYVAVVAKQLLLSLTNVYPVKVVMYFSSLVQVSPLDTITISVDCSCSCCRYYCDYSTSTIICNNFQLAISSIVLLTGKLNSDRFTVQILL